MLHNNLLGLNWAFLTQQPERALLNHHGHLSHPQYLSLLKKKRRRRMMRITRLRIVTLLRHLLMKSQNRDGESRIYEGQRTALANLSCRKVI